jgi:hypothetical protein
MRLWKVNMGMTIVGNVCSISLAIDAILKELKLHGREVSDADIVHWANLKVRNVGKTSRMENFKVKYISIKLFAVQNSSFFSSGCPFCLLSC